MCERIRLNLLTPKIKESAYILRHKMRAIVGHDNRLTRDYLPISHDIRCHRLIESASEYRIYTEVRELIVTFKRDRQRDLTGIRPVSRATHIFRRQIYKIGYPSVT